jgi:hypothetical protein
LAAIVVLVHLLDGVEHCVAVLLVLIHPYVLTQAEVLILLVKLAETTLKDVALGVAQLGIFVHVHVPVQAA